MSEIRRVLLVQPLAGARWRSINAYADSLADMLRAAGVEVDVAAAPWFNPPSLARGARARWLRQEEFRRLERGEYDIVHLTDQALAHHGKRLRRHAPVIVTCHDLMPFTTPGYYESNIEAHIKRAFLRRPIRQLRNLPTIAVSEFTRGELTSFLGLDGEEVAVVPNVVRGVFQPASPEQAEGVLAEAGFALPSGLRVLSVGNDRAYKNLPGLFAALAHPSLAHASLVRVGAPLDGSTRRLMNELGLARRVTELGQITDEQLACVYAACNVLAQPSLGEGFGLPVIEAMACGLPVVVSDGGALREVVADAGIVVPLASAGFPARFAHGLLEAIGSKDRLVALGFDRAKDFQPQAVVEGLLASYRHACHRSQA